MCFVKNTLCPCSVAYSCDNQYTAQTPADTDTCEMCYDVVERDGIPVRRLDSQSREPGFKAESFPEKLTWPWNE